MTDFHGNPVHLELVKKDPKALNQWLEARPGERMNLHGANLMGATFLGGNFLEADLHGVDLTRADLRGADFRGADLGGAKLIDTELGGADLRGANLIDANLTGANLIRADFTRADLSRANFSGADLGGAILVGANFTRANLTRVDLSGARLDEAVFTEALIMRTFFVDNDLSAVKGLETCRHLGPSPVDVSVLRMAGKLPRVFLQGMGLPVDIINDLARFFEAPIHYHSLFISYSTKDEAFADQLYRDLQHQGIRCWYSPTDIKGGAYLHEQIKRAIAHHDRLLLILSEHSMNSEWVITEITTALEREKEENRRVLFPIRLIGYQAIKKWECFDPDFGTDLAKKVRRYFIPDFRNPDEYPENLSRLVRDLREA